MEPVETYVWYPGISVRHTPEALDVLVQALGALPDHLDKIRPKNQSFQCSPVVCMGTMFL